MMRTESAKALCQEYLPLVGPKFKVIISYHGDIPVIETIVSMKALSALSMRMYELGWLLGDVNGVISRIEIETNVQTDPLVYVEYQNPTSFLHHDEIPEHFPVN